MTYTWQKDNVLVRWWSCMVSINGYRRSVSLVQRHEQPEYWQFFRGDGKDALIAGPTDFEGAKAFGEKWLAEHRADPA